MTKTTKLPLIFVEAKKEFQETQLSLVASSLAYTTILSVIPALAVSFAIFQAFGGLDKLYATVEPFILENLAQGSGEQVALQIQQFVQNAHASAIGIGGLLGLIFTTMAMLASIEKAVNQIWRVPIRRSWFQRFSYYWLLITLGPLALAVALGLMTSSQLAVSKIFPSGLGLFLMSVGGFFCLYKFVPNCPVRSKPALISSFSSALCWDLGRRSYQIYIRHFVSYNKVYGSLAAVPILLLWIYIAWLIVLSGAALTAALQRKTRLT